MATTPNYGWVTPAPTDFVTDLPADFETFADAVDADLAGLLGGTTGQVLAKDSNSDHDFSWTTIATPSTIQPYLVAKNQNLWVRPVLGGDFDEGSDSSTLTQNTTYYTPIFLPTCKILNINIRTSATFAGNYGVRIGIYNNGTDNVPTTVLRDAGTITATTAVTNYSITINEDINEGWYWSAVNMQTITSAGTPRFYGITSSGGQSRGLLFPMAGGPSEAKHTGFSETGISGAFATAGTITSSSNFSRPFLQYQID